MLISHVKYARWEQTDDGLRLGSYNFSFDLPHTHAAVYIIELYLFVIQSARSI